MSGIVAAFDFDGTLTRRDTLVPFLAAVAGRAATGRALAVESPRLARMALGRADRDETKERVLTRVLAGRAFTDVATAGRTFGAALAARGLAPETRARLDWHRAAGHRVVIVSASLDVYLDEVAEALGADALLCSNLEVDTAGACTGRIAGGNCRGPEKAKRLREYLGDDDVELWAYGDSSGDDEMLALAHHPMRVRRGRLTTA
jgi:phosphatidylglycerophosphatase C